MQVVWVFEQEFTQKGKLSDINPRATGGMEATHAINLVYWNMFKYFSGSDF